MSRPLRRLNGDTRFEQTILAGSSCAVHGYDGTLVGPREALKAKLPPERNAASNATFTFHPINFDAQTWKQYASERVSMLKIDCEGCGAPAPRVSCPKDGALHSPALLLLSEWDVLRHRCCGAQSGATCHHGWRMSAPTKFSSRSIRGLRQISRCNQCP